MHSVFSISEIVRFAIEIEKEGVLFYNTLASKIKNEDVKTVFKKLSADETIHQAIFEALLSSLESNEELDSLENEYTAYLNAMIKNKVFDQKKIEALAQSFSSDFEALEYAISKEKDSIIFYLNLKKLTDKSEDISNIEKIIKEEQTHVLKLLDLKEKVN